MSVSAERAAKQSANKSELSAAPQYQHSDGDATGEAVEHHNVSSTSERSPVPTVPTTAPPSISPHQRQGDCGSGDDGAAQRSPVFVRFHDLRAAGIVSNWPQLYNLIDDYGFPAGMLLSPNCRVWDVRDVHVWLDARPTERKIVNPRRRLKEKEVA
jgi:hypothetical protein